MSSKSIQNSSLAASLAVNVAFDKNDIKLFTTVFHPSSALSLQLVFKLVWDDPRASDIPRFVELWRALVTSKYFLRSLRSFRLTHVPLALVQGLVDVELALPEDKRLLLADGNRLDEFVLRPQEGAEAAAAFALTVKRLPPLRALDLSFTGHESSALMDFVLKQVTSPPHVSSLTSLNLADCGKITDAVLQVIASKLPNLTNFSLSRSDPVTDIGLQAIASNLPNLRQLRLDRCTRITDVGIEFVASNLRNLTNLKLRKLRNLTNVGLQAVANNLPNLTSLDICYNRRISGVGVKKIVSKLKNVKDLCVENFLKESKRY